MKMYEIRVKEKVVYATGNEQEAKNVLSAITRGIEAYRGVDPVYEWIKIVEVKL